MKNIGYIVMGIAIVLGVQFIEKNDFSLITKANAAGNSKPCRVINVDETKINNLYRFGYRVKGVGASAAGDAKSYEDRTRSYVVMCKE